MGKLLSNYKQLTWELCEPRQRFLIDLRPIGGPQKKSYRTKTEMWDVAKALFELWRGDGEVPLRISGETG